MEIYFNKLMSVLAVNDKKENVRFLLSEKIVNCSNTLSNDNFFILKNSKNDIFIDKILLADIENELTCVINDYIKNNLHHLDKVNKANEKLGGIFLDRNSNGALSVVNVKSFDIVNEFISIIINETNSSTLKKDIFNKVKCPNVNLFFYKYYFSKIKMKSVSRLMEDLSNKTIELNPGCNLPFKPSENKFLFIKLGSVEAANNKVKLESEVKIKNEVKIKSEVKNNIEPQLNEKDIKISFTQFEISFNFFNQNINKLYNIINNYYKFASLNNANDTFGFIKDGDEIVENIYKIINEKDKDQSMGKCLDIYNEFNENHKLLNVFHQDFVKKSKNNLLEKCDIEELSKMTRKIESNTDSLAIELKLQEPFSNAYNNYEKKVKNEISNMAIKNNSCRSIYEITTKTNECLSLLDECIKRKKTGFFSKVYKFFFPKKYNESVSLLMDYKNEVNKILSYLELYKKEENKFFSDDIILIITSKLSRITYPESLLGYLYGEKSKWNNFKQSLFKKDE